MTDEALASVGHVEGFRFCFEEDCDIVYYHPQTGERYLCSDMRVDVWQKQTQPSRSVCYCFNHTVEDIEAEVARTGSSTLLSDISEKCRQGLDRCEETNPQGSCCLGNVKKTIEQARVKYGKMSNRKGGVWGSLTAAPAVIVGFLPAVTCPACWPVYAGLMGSLGLGFLTESRYLLSTMAVLLMVAIMSLAISGRRRRGYGPFMLGLAGGVIMLVGKFLLTVDAVMYGGIGMLIAASFWNAWPLSKQKSAACGSCCQTK